MRTSTKMLFLVLFVVSTATIMTGYAFADSSTDATLAGVSAATAFKTGGFGALAGVLLSFMTIINKNHQGAGEKIDPYKLGANLILGAVIGIGLSWAGIDATKLTGNSEIVQLAIFAVNYFFLHAINLTTRPLFGNWIKGKKANPSAPASSATAETK